MNVNYQTPEAVCEYMASLIPDGVKRVLEPTPGNGNLVSVLQQKYEVEAPEDFFLTDTKKVYDCIIMNPPFSDKTGFMHNAPADVNLKGMRYGYYILDECMKRSDNIIALMPWFTILDSDIRARALKAFGLKSLTTLPRKTFGYARIQTVIMELERGYKGETIFKTLAA